MHEQRIDLLEAYCNRSNTKKFAGAQVAAMIWLRGTCIGAGYNRNKSHPKAKKFSKNEHAIFIHAELDALMNASNGLFGSDCTKGATLYVLRLKYTDRSRKSQVRALAKPCPGCIEAMMAYGIKEVFYTTDEGFEKLEEYSTP